MLKCISKNEITKVKIIIIITNASFQFPLILPLTINPLIRNSFFFHYLILAYDLLKVAQLPHY